MAAVTDGASGSSDSQSALSDTGYDDRYNLAGVAIVALLVGVLFAWTARSSAVALLVAVAVGQALLASAWVLSIRRPGRNGALVIAALTAGAADAAVSVWPHSRLGSLVAVLALAMSVLFVHQLLRGAARVRVLDSLGGVAVLVLAELALPALLQVRHEFPTDVDVAFGVALIAAGALLVGALADLTFDGLRFDDAVPRGAFGVLGSTVAGALLGDLTLRNSALFGTGRGLFLGAALGALVALFAVATSFMEHTTPLPDSGFPRRGRPLVTVLLPLSLLSPVAFLLCIAIHA
jgi:hypothetical protein